jgi:hypothetical protein
MEIFAIIGLLTAYFRYRNSKADGTLVKEQALEQAEPYVQKPLPANATRLQKIAYWLGIEDE